MFAQNHHGQSRFDFGSSQSAAQDYKLSCRNPTTTVPSASTYMPTPSLATTSHIPTSMSFRYYQPPKPSRVDSESEDETSEDASYKRRGSRNASSINSQTKRGACMHCKGLKVRCHFSPLQSSCQRCILNKLQCVVNGRKKRRAVATHEELLLKSHKQDIEIANLLRQFDELATDKRIQTWIEKASSKYARSSQSPISQHSMPGTLSSSTGRDHTSWTSSYGYGELGSPCSQVMDMNMNYLLSPSSQFTSSPKERFSIQELLEYFPDASVTPYTKPPEIVARGIIDPKDVGELFAIYFKFINPYFSVLDPVLHTPERLFWHSHFLFTLICCISTKYSHKYAPMVPLFVEFARDLAGKTLVQGRKTIDECQAFLIQSVYQMPRKRFEDQRGWLTMGLAFSLALELRLDKPPSVDDIAYPHSPEGLDSKDAFAGEMAERQRLNCVRTWLNCYCVDASHATQFGKPAVLDVEDYTARTCREWYCSSSCTLPIDVHLVAYVEICRVMRHFRIEVGQMEAEEKEHPEKPRNVKKVLEKVERYHGELLKLYHEWSDRFRSHPRYDDYMCPFRADTHRMINAFNRLVVLFYGLQRAVAANESEEGAGVSRDDELVRRCIETAKEVIKGMIYKLYPTGMLRYSLEAHFLFATFAAAHLLSILRPEMSVLLRPGDVEEIDYLVRELVKVLRSKEVSEDGHGRHAPFLYARYLTKQLKKFSPLRPGSNAVGFQSMGGAPHGFDPRCGNVVGRAWAGPAADAAYHNMTSDVGGQTFQGDRRGESTGCNQMYQLSGYPLDFSLISFLQTVNEPQFAKATPPPGEAEDAGQWWQHMYPVSNQTLPESCEWPMAMGGQAPVTFNGQKQQISPDF